MSRRSPRANSSLDLAFEATQPILLQGQQGYSRKGPEVRQASWYYSRPQLAVRGRIVVGGRARDVEGRAWLDHEWSSEVMAENAAGWDWIGINLDDGGALMAFRMRDRDGARLWAGGARRGADGRTEILAPDAVRFAPGRRWTSPRTGFSYPVEFVVDAGGVDYALAPLMDDQELDSRASTGVVYWEGAVTRECGRAYRRARVPGAHRLRLDAADLAVRAGEQGPREAGMRPGRVDASGRHRRIAFAQPVAEAAAGRGSTTGYRSCRRSDRTQRPNTRSTSDRNSESSTVVVIGSW